MNVLVSIVLFAQLVSPFETKATLDANGRFLIYARYFKGELISIDSVKSLYEYLDQGMFVHNRALLLQELKRDLVQQGGYANKGLFGTFEIPLPKGGFGDFMGETGKLDVGGYIKVTLGGSETFMSNLPGEQRPSWLPELEMKQEMAINLDGQVGDRMRVFIDHNSERISETQNKITVTYQGKEDEIIQEIEGGDTQLSIPATTYTGDIPSHRGLFGIKSTAKLGPLDIQAIASKEQTQTQEIEIEGSTQAQYDTIWARFYERRRFLWLGTYDSIIELEVYVDDNNRQNDNMGITYPGWAFLDTLDDNIPDDTSNGTNRRQGNFTLKREPTDYLFTPGENIIELNYALPEYNVLAVYYKKLVNGDVVEVGRVYETDSTVYDTVQLKLICPERLDTTSYTWRYERKNYYQVVSPGSRLDTLRIYKVTSGEPIDRQGEIPFIQVLGLDAPPFVDGLVDENTVYLSGRGLLKFPDPEPFADSNLLDDPDPEIYTNPYMQTYGKYYLYMKTSESKPVYALPENIEQVWVYVNDVLQDSVKDYHVNYDEGRLEFKKPIQTSDKVRIKVEYAPFFSAAQKSLVGVRGSLRPFGEAMLGSSFFYRTETYPAEHIRLREEPFNRMIWEVDFAYPQELPFFTKLVDALPLVKTEAESKMNINVEGAYSFSKLNSSGEVYLDDLESTTIISNDFSIGRTSWVLSSQPVGTDTTNFVLQRLIWFNPRDRERLSADDIYEDPQDPNEIADVLKVVMRPDDTLSFAGLTQYIYGENFDEIENLEVIINGKGGRIHVDFAQEISEDQLRRDKNGQIVGRGLKDDEDSDGNNVWNSDEDTGLDGVYGDDDANVAGDDGNDDYEQDDYTGKINGTELNKIWDTEDIDRNGVLNSEDRYYSFSINLDDTTQFFVSNAGLKEGWKMFRVPIKDSLLQDTVTGQPDWRDMKYVRIWFDGFAHVETLSIYRLSATGSRWKNFGIIGYKLPPAPSEVFTLTPVNTKTHSYYISPYPEERNEFGVVKTEGGLEFRLENILNGHTCVAHRRTDDNEDYRAYDTLTFYLRSSKNAVSTAANFMVSIRLGVDSVNYYEYTAAYDEGALKNFDYRLYSISLQRFIELKKEQPSAGDTITDSTYTVVGNPSLSRNQFFEVRITNPFVTPLTDTIWFNDVKLTAPQTEVGRIFRGNGVFNFADLASLNFSYDESNGRFKRLSETKDISTQSAGRGYSVNSSIFLNKFLPEGWHFNIPIGLSYRKTTHYPRFSYFADDIEIIGEESEEQQSSNIQKSYSVSLSKSGSRLWLLKHTLDQLSLSHDRSQSYSRSTLNADTSDMKSYRAAYALNPKFAVKFLNQVFSPLPSNVSLNAAYTDNIVKSFYRADIDSPFTQTQYGTQRHRTLSPSLSVAYSPHSMLTTNYSFSQTRDSVSARRRFGEEVGRNQSFNASLTRDLKIVSPRLTFSSSYTEDFRYEIRQNQGLRNVSNAGKYGIDGTVNVKGIVRFFTGLRDETKDSSLATGSPGWFAKQIESFFNVLDNPTVNYSRQRNSNYLNVRGRPDLNYQWGLADSLPAENVAQGSYPGRGMMDMYGIKSRMTLKIMSLSGEYNGSINKSFSYGGNETRTNNVSYPNLTLRVQRLEELPILKKWSRSSSLTTSFTQSFEQRFDDTTRIRDSKGITLNPLVSWQSAWQKGISTTVDVNYSATNANEYSGAAAAVPSRTLTRGGSLTLAYTFSAPRGLSLPLLGGIRFASNLSMNLTANYSRSTSYFSDLTKATSDASTLGTALGLTYNFSSSVTGGANFDVSQNKDMIQNQSSRRVGLNIWMNINF